jgi:hypothetical protein
MYALILFLIVFSTDRADAANSQLVTVTLVSPSWNTGLPTAVARLRVARAYFAMRI